MPSLLSTSITAERERLNRIHHPERFEHPDAYAYLDRKVVPTGIDIKRSQFDLALGVWAHLLADNVEYARQRVSDEIGGHPNEEFRIKNRAISTGSAGRFQFRVFRVPPIVSMRRRRDLSSIPSSAITCLKPSA